MKVTSLTTAGARSAITISDALFVVPTSQQTIAQAIRVYLSNARQGTSKVKTRSEINRTKKKWFKQKGTGNARHGARNANIFVGGGVSHGPNGEQNWLLSLPKTQKHMALRMALALQAEQLIVAPVSELSGKTKAAAALLNQVANNDDSILVVLAETDAKVVRSLRNIPRVQVTTAYRVNALDIAQVRHIVFDTAAFALLEERLATTPVAAEKAVPAAKVAKPAVVAKPAAKKAAPKAAVKKAAPRKKATTA